MLTQICVTLNNMLDSLTRPTIKVLGKPRSAFQVCGYTGLVLAVALAMALVASRGLPLWVMLAVILSAVFTFFALAMLSKIVLGEERLVYYHHEIAVLCVAALLLWALGQPVLAYLDATLLGVGIFLACGRIGCFMVGCCHGRPHDWGVRYRHEHADAGFPDIYVGVRLFPTQVVESLWALAVVCGGSLIVLLGGPAGEALAWYVVTYDLERFYIEFMRGDLDRPNYRGFSQAQWLALVLTWLVVVAELFGLLPFRAWHVLVGGLIAATMLIIALRRRLPGGAEWQLLQPPHIWEVAQAVNTPASRYTPGEGKVQVEVHATSLGIQISSGTIGHPDKRVRHYTVSHRYGKLPENSARALARLIRQIGCPRGTGSLVLGNNGTFHLVVQDAE